MEKELKVVYKKYKKVLLPMILFVCSSFMIFQVIIPQWNSITSLREDVATKEFSLEQSKKSLEILSITPDSNLTNDFELATTAFPIQKDIVLMFTSLSEAANATGVELGGFSLKVGGIYDATNQYKNEKIIDGVPYLNVVVEATGSEDNITQFARKLYAGLPVIEINSINIQGKQGHLDVNFFFKPVSTQLAKQTKIASYTPEETKLLKTLAEWKQ